MSSLPQSYTKDCYLNVQAMRAIAALLVVLGHTLALGGMELPRYLGGGLVHTFAYAGVDIFFVISGFVICAAASKHLASTSNSNGLQRATAFLLRRVFRIYPLYWVLLLAAFCLAYFHNPGLLALPRELIVSLFLLTERNNPVLSPAWSLVFEMYFYLCTAFILLLSRSRWLLLMAVWFGLSCGLIFSAKSLGLEGRLYTDPLLLEFGFGCLIFFAISRNYVLAPMLASVTLLLGAVFFFWGAQQTLHQGLLPPMPRVQSFGVGSALLLYALICLEHQAQLTMPRLLIALGTISYSIYLVHRPLIDLGLILVARYQIQVQAYPVLLSSLMMAIVIAASAVLYRYLERPMISIGSRLARRCE
ncbi:acyltransferase [Undibacterium cyanobacteriorum]|uniref:Acyltransferase n=1 Tax=Undibacterium cyanobacteriorum TaxID=3073561 RepID=A0ABY9RF68_9BURK|nr:acyltransferase [Undibacterium sp. 20NA77.5]WMW79868.1 acyltransferase [Undibacterium sp. 20NA77.5]